jgi:hypothetical protein
MTLTLKAGRMMGMPSIFDKGTELYRYFHDDILIDSKGGDVQVTLVGNNPNMQISPSNVLAKENSKTYIAQPGDTVEIITRKFYQNRQDYSASKIKYMNEIIELNKNEKDNFGKKFDKTSIVKGQKILIPKDTHSVYSVKSGDNMGSVIHFVYSSESRYQSILRNTINTVLVKSNLSQDSIQKNKLNPVPGTILKNAIDVDKKITNPKTYTIQKGDNWGKILYSLYSSDKSYLKIMSSYIFSIETLNTLTKDLSGKPFHRDKIREGMQVIIPNSINTAIDLRETTKNEIFEDEHNDNLFSIRLMWSSTQSSEDKSNYYYFHVYSNNKFLEKVSSNSYVVSNLKKNTNYTFFIKVSDSYGNFSSKSKSLFLNYNGNNLDQAIKHEE